MKKGSLWTRIDSIEGEVLKDIIETLRPEDFDPGFAIDLNDYLPEALKSGGIGE